MQFKSPFLFSRSTLPFHVLWPVIINQHNYVIHCLLVRVHNQQCYTLPPLKFPFTKTSITASICLIIMLQFLTVYMQIAIAYTYVTKECAGGPTYTRLTFKTLSYGLFPSKPIQGGGGRTGC